MPPPGKVVMRLFALIGLASGLLIIPLAFVWLPLVFLCEGALFALGLATAYRTCRSWLPRVGSLYIGASMMVLVVGFPLAILFGGALSLASQFLLQTIVGLNHLAQDSAPLTILAFMLFWGALASALFVNLALTVITAEWDNRTMLLLSLAGVGSAAASFCVYLLFYDSADPMVTRYRELALFGIMAPVGNATFGAVCGYGILRAVGVENILLLRRAAAGARKAGPSAD